MIVYETVVVAFSLFSALPMPRVDWNARNMKYSLCAFPLVGVVIGLACRGWDALAVWLSLPALLRGAGLCLVPVLITGGIHLDGYADTCDALASHSDAETMQRILKDPHMGAFAAIRLCAYLIASFALWTAIPTVRLGALLRLFGLSRALSALALTLFPLREGSGLARSFAEAADKKRVRAILIPTAAVFALLLAASGGWAAALACLPVFWYYRRLCVRCFGGLSGDLAGWFLQTAELWMLGMLVLTQYMERVL